MASVVHRKMRGRYCAATDAAAPYIEEVLRRPEVTTVSLETIKAGSPEGRPGIWISYRRAGLLVTVCGGNDVQEVVVNTSSRYATEKALRAVSPGDGSKKKE